MGMVVRSNIMAVNAQRQLGVNNSQVSKALEKLSSGYRINRAGDDASGLAISEKMKAQIKVLDTASLNAQDGISLVQTAEGALTETHNMLNRMAELATRAANGINSEQNRQALQLEVDKLKTEIDRIANSTDFNGFKLLAGAEGGDTDTDPTNPTNPTTPAFDLTKISATLGGTKTNLTDQPATPAQGSVAKANLSASSYTIKYKDKDGNAGTDVNLTGLTTNDADGLKAAIAGNSTLSALFEVDTSDATNAVIKLKADAGKAEITGIETGGAGVTGYAWTPEKKAGKVLDLGASGMAANDTIQVGEKTYKMVGGTADATKGEFTDFAGLKALVEADGGKVESDNSTTPLAANAKLTFTAAAAKGKSAPSPQADEKPAYGKDSTWEFDLSSITPKVGDKVTVGGKTYEFVNAGTTNPTTAGDIVVEVDGADKAKSVSNLADKIKTDTDLAKKFDVSAAAGKITFKAKADAATGDAAPTMTATGFTAPAAKADLKEAAGGDNNNNNNNNNGGTGDVTLQVGESSQITVKAQDMTSVGIGVDGISIEDQAGAVAAIQTIKASIDNVSSYRAELGATQNRLEYTINNLDTTSENIQAANSRIRDTDMAKMMMEYTKVNVVTQSAQAMLAQANQQPQSVLQLLQ